MAEAKTKETAASVDAFLSRVEDPKKREDCRTLVSLMKEATGAPPKMWGTGIVGFGSYHYKYESGHEGDTCVLGFAPRKDALTLYIAAGGIEQLEKHLERLGKHKTGKGCLYIKKLEDVDLGVLRKLLAAAAKRRAGDSKKKT